MNANNGVTGHADIQNMEEGTPPSQLNHNNNLTSCPTDDTNFTNGSTSLSTASTLQPQPTSDSHSNSGVSINLQNLNDSRNSHHSHYSSSSHYSNNTHTHSKNNGKSLSDSILNSYRRTQSDDSIYQSSSSAIHNTHSANNNAVRSNTSQKIRLLSNSHFGLNASIHALQRTSAAKDEIRNIISKTNECISMVERHQSLDSSLIHLCQNQIQHNLSKLILYIQDDYYRIITLNLNGIRTTIQTMSTFCDIRVGVDSCMGCMGGINNTNYENLIATCHLVLAILCHSSSVNTNSSSSTSSTNHHPQFLNQLLECNGIHVIVNNILKFPTSDKVCSTGIDVLNEATSISSTAGISSGNVILDHLRQIDNIVFILNGTNDYLYPLSKQHKDILVQKILNY